MRDIRFGVPLRFAGLSIDEDRAVDVLAVPPADPVGDGRRHPVWVSIVVDLEGDRLKHPCRVAETDVAVDIAEEIFTGGILHAGGQPDEIGILIDHIDSNVCRKSLLLVVKPFDRVGIAQRRHAVRCPLIVDLCVIFLNLKLGDQVGHLTELFASEPGGGVLINDRDLRHAKLCDI